MAPKVILIADSHHDSRVVYSTILQYGGFVVLEARNGAETLEMVSKHMPDAVITDLILPVIDGCEVLRRLKQHPVTSHIPVCIVTANNSPELRQQAEAANSDLFIVKPCAPSALLQAVRAVLDKSIPPTLV